MNTACMGRVLEETMRGPSVLKLYYELGGKIITTGSDAHTPERIAYGFEAVEEIMMNMHYSDDAQPK